jgi:hypothetical protein
MRLLRYMLFAVLAAGVIAPAAYALAITDATLNPPQGVVGTPYSHQFEAHGGCPPYHYAVINGSLPPGLSLSDEGLISGTPTQAGGWSFSLDLFDTKSSSCPSSPIHSQRYLSISIIDQMLVATPSLPSAFVDTPYSAQLALNLTGVTAHWSLASGSLPAGLTLSDGGLISGTPTAAGSSTFSVKAQDTGNNRSATKQFTLAVVTKMVASPPAGAPRSEVGAPLVMTPPTATGGTQPYTWSLAAGVTLPAGLTVDQATGAITGKPTAAGTFPLTLQVTGGDGQTATVDLTLSVAPRLAISRTQHVGPTKLGKPYRVKIKLEGGVGAPRFRLAGGVLPKGIRLDVRTGTLVGRPTEVGRRMFLIEATDSLGVTARRAYTLIVKGPVVKAKKK